MAGKPPLPQGQARSEKLYTKVKPAAHDLFVATAARLGFTKAEALRQAAEDWTRKHSR